MKNTLRSLLFAVLLAVAVADGAAAASACPPVAGNHELSAEMMQAARLRARDHGFLWQISKDGRSSYLYGTIHLAKPDWMFPGPSVIEALRTVDTVALELDVADADIEARMLKGLALLRATPLPEPLATRLRRQAEVNCVPYETLADLSPELQITMLSGYAGRWSGLEAAYAIDAVLAGIGHSIDKLVISLETVELQLQLLQMRNRQETIAFVEAGLDELETGRTRSMIDRIARAWSEADYAEMARFDEWCECLNTPIEREVMKRSLDERNPDLAARIDALHRNGHQVFAAVGSLHMFGPLGLPALLAQRGYRVERVAPKPR